MNTIKSTAWDQIDFNSRNLINNVWGVGQDEKLTSSIFVNNENNFGWNWSRLDAKPQTGVNYIKPIYPSMRIGGSPWVLSESKYFPIKLGQIQTLQLDCSYNYVKIPSGSFNLSYDIFFCDTDQICDKPVIKAEVMIWINSTIKRPQDAYKGEFTDGNNTYQLYAYVMPDGRQYYSFDMSSKPQQNGYNLVDVKALLDNLKLDPGLYIHGVELGTEIYNGSGEILINKFNINLNGHYI